MKAAPGNPSGTLECGGKRKRHAAFGGDCGRAHMASSSVQASPRRCRRPCLALPPHSKVLPATSLRVFGSSLNTVRHFLAIVAAFALLGCAGEEIEIETGYRGKARRDPFLAAERFLTENDFEVSTHTWIGDRLPPGATLIATAQSFGNRGTTDSVLTWVARGGHLLVLLDGGETFRDDWDRGHSDRNTRAQPERTELLEKLGIEEPKDGGGPLEVKLADSSASVKMPARFTWKKGRAPVRPDIVGADGNSIALASFRRGAGRISIAAHAEPFRNRHLGEGDNAWLLLRLVGHARGAEVWFLNGMKVSFFGMLWEHGWMALIAAAALLAAWLWKSLPRFGPLRAAEESGTRDFAEHLSLTGAFLWRHRQRAQLIGPLRETVTRAAVRRGLLRNDPGFLEKLAAFAQMDLERVRHAVLSDGVGDPRSFLRAVQDLRQLHEKVSA